MKNTKTLILIVLFLLALGFLGYYFLNRKDTTNKNYPDNTYFYKVGSKIEHEFSMGYEFTIKSENSSELKVESNQTISDSESGINLMSNKEDFIVLKNGDEKEISTTTLDAGATFVFKYIDDGHIQIKQDTWSANK